MLPLVTASPLFNSDSKAERLSAAGLGATTGAATGGGGGGGAGPAPVGGGGAGLAPVEVGAALPSTFQVRPVVWKSDT